MKRSAVAFFAIIITILCFVSCAKAPSENIKDEQKLSFDAWVSLYGEGAERKPSGIYMKTIEASTSPSAKRPAVNDWVRIKYTGRNMTSGDVFVTRYADIAKLEGSFEYYTNYAADYQRMTTYNAYITPGMRDALTYMKEGERCHIYIPPYYSYENPPTFQYGYQGYSMLGQSQPVFMDITLEAVVRDPLEYENKEVRDYATGVLGMALTDTVKTDLYRQILYTRADTAVLRNDSVARVFYTGRFLNGFVFASNIDDTLKKYNLPGANQMNDAMLVKVRNPWSSDSDSDSDSDTSTGTDTTIKYTNVIQGFNDGMLGMRFGQKANLVFTSTFGYGVNGKNPTDGTTGTVFLPYQSLFFTVEVAPSLGEGTFLFPYTANWVRSVTAPVPDVWVEGFVTGAVEGPHMNDVNFYQWPNTKDNIVISSKVKDPGISNTIVIELPEGPIRDALNLIDNPKLYQKKIKIYGTASNNIRSSYGMINVTQYRKP